MLFRYRLHPGAGELAPVLSVPARQQRKSHPGPVALLPRQARSLQRLSAAGIWALGIIVALMSRRMGDRLLLVGVVVLACSSRCIRSRRSLPAAGDTDPVDPRRERVVQGRVLARPAAVRRYESREQTPASERRVRPDCRGVVLAGVSIVPTVTATQAIRSSASARRRSGSSRTVAERRRDDALEGLGPIRDFVLRETRLVSLRPVPARDRIPGAEIQSPRPDPSGEPSRDWVDYWPPRLIEAATSPTSSITRTRGRSAGGSDRPVDQQQKFRDFIEAYGGQLVHTVPATTRPAWIYRISELLAQPKVSYARRGNNVVVTGEGFRFNSHVKIYYHRVPRDRSRPTRTARSRRAFRCRTGCTRTSGSWRSTLRGTWPRNRAHRLGDRREVHPHASSGGSSPDVSNGKHGAPPPGPSMWG